MKGTRDLVSSMACEELQHFVGIYLLRLCRDTLLCWYDHSLPKGTLQPPSTPSASPAAQVDASRKLLPVRILSPYMASHRVIDTQRITAHLVTWSEAGFNRHVPAGETRYEWIRR